jgi:hypothetical protein
MDWITGLPTSADGSDVILVFIDAMTGMRHFQACIISRQDGHVKRYGSALCPQHDQATRRATGDTLGSRYPTDCTLLEIVTGALGYRAEANGKVERATSRDETRRYRNCCAPCVTRRAQTGEIIWIWPNS